MSIAADDAELWNPRTDAFEHHFVVLLAGDLLPLTATGEFTARRLRLNRPQLVMRRLLRQRANEELQLLDRYREIVLLLENLLRQKTGLVAEQRRLLEEYKRLLLLMTEQSLAN